LGRFYIKAGAFMKSIPPELWIKARQRRSTALRWPGVDRFRGEETVVCPAGINVHEAQKKNRSEYLDGEAAGLGAAPV